MSVPTSAYEPPHAPAPPPRKTLRNVSIGCGGVLFACVLALGSCFLVTKHTGDQVTPVVDAYFASVAAGDFHGAYAAFAPQMHSATSERDYVSFDEGVRARLGKLESKTVTQTQTGYGTEGGWAFVNYRCKFAAGDAAVQFKLMEADHTWRIAGLHYDSPVLTDALRSTGKTE